MVTFGIAEAEETFLQNMILLVPKGYREAEELFAIAKDEDGLNYTLYQASGFRKRLAIKMKRKIDLKLAIESEKLGIQYMKDDGSGEVFVPLPV